MTVIILRLGDRTVQARVSPDGHVLLDDTRFTVEPESSGTYLVSDGNRRWHVAVAAAGDTRWVSVDGQVAVLETGAAAGARRKAHGAGAMTAPMPATVVKILVEPGQAVTEGETVMVLEAMKMELPIKAPQAGVVKTVRCAVGDLVQPDVPLVDLA